MKESKTKYFIKKVDDVNLIYNKTKDIYFDNEYLYLDIKEEK